jgi:transcriptional regulator with XRE-family HTH domain
MLIWHELIFCQPKYRYSCDTPAVSQETFDGEVGRILAVHRRDLGISQEFLSSMLRKDQTFVSKLETGKRSISLFEFLRWCKALNLAHPEMLKILSKIENHVE